MVESRSCGIVGMGFYLPEKQVPIGELAAAAGIPDFVAAYAGAQTVREADPAELPSDMAAAAARRALADGALDPGQIDLVVYCGAGVPDYITPPTAGRIQDAIGAANAFGFDLAQGCAGMLTGLQMAKAAIHLDEGIDTVLLAVGDKWSQFTRFHSADSIFFGDGGGAVILRQGHPDLRPLGTHIVTQGQYHDLWGIAAGGLRQPASRQTVADEAHIYQSVSYTHLTLPTN